MSPNHLPVCYRQSFSRSSTSNSLDRLSLHPIESEVWSRQSPPPLTLPYSNSCTIQSPDLFATLLFDRERVYRDSSAPVVTKFAERNNPEQNRTTPYSDNTSQSSSSQKAATQLLQERTHVLVTTHRRFSQTFVGDKTQSEESSMPLLSHLERQDGTVKAKPEENRSKKRLGANESIESRAFKISKSEPKANIGKKVDSSDSHMLITSASLEVIELSDTEEEAGAREDCEQRLAMLQCLRSWQSQKKATARSISPIYTKHTDSPGSKSDLTPKSIDIVKADSFEIEEVQKASWNSQAANQTVKKPQQEMEQREADALLEMHNLQTRTEREVATLIRELEAAKQETRIIADQCSQLREKLQLSQDALSRRTETNYEALQACYTQQEDFYKGDQRSFTDVLNDIPKRSAEQKDTQEQVASLQRGKAQLAAEIEILRVATRPSRNGTILSPGPLLSSSANEDKREDNVRKMYIKTKRQYDILRSVANDLATCTRSMDLSSFGEFGKYMRKLRASLNLEEDGGHDGQALDVRKGV